MQGAEPEVSGPVAVVKHTVREGAELRTGPILASPFSDGPPDNRPNLPEAGRRPSPPNPPYYAASPPAPLSGSPDKSNSYVFQAPPTSSMVLVDSTQPPKGSSQSLDFTPDSATRTGRPKAGPSPFIASPPEESRSYIAPRPNSPAGSKKAPGFALPPPGPVLRLGTPPVQPTPLTPPVPPVALAPPPPPLASFVNSTTPPVVPNYLTPASSGPSFAASQSYLPLAPSGPAISQAPHVPAPYTSPLATSSFPPPAPFQSPTKLTSAPTAQAKSSRPKAGPSPFGPVSSPLVATPSLPPKMAVAEKKLEVGNRVQAIWSQDQQRYTAELLQYDPASDYWCSLFNCRYVVFSDWGNEEWVPSNSIFR